MQETIQKYLSIKSLAKDLTVRSHHKRLPQSASISLPCRTTDLSQQVNCHTRSVTRIGNHMKNTEIIAANFGSLKVCRGNKWWRLLRYIINSDKNRKFQYLFGISLNDAHITVHCPSDVNTDLRKVVELANQIKRLPPLTASSYFNTSSCDKMIYAAVAFSFFIGSLLNQ